jgi:hypothetical protein
MHIDITGLYVFPNGSNGTVALFDATLDGVVTLKGLALKLKDDGKYRWSSPAKQRVKNGQAVQDDQGRNIWDDHVRLAVDPETHKVTAEAWKFFDAVLTAAVDAYVAKQGASGRGGSAAPARQGPPARQAAPAAGAGTKAAAAVKPKKEESFDDFPDGLDEDDSDLLF